MEKLQTVPTKFRQQQNNGEIPSNFLRHYYGISQLPDHPEVTAFIAPQTTLHEKKQRFRKDDNLIIAKKQPTLAYQTTVSRYFGE